jgi:hypothetical protein
MQELGYGYLYSINIFINNRMSEKQFFAAQDASGIQLLTGISDILAALNVLGVQGWIISESYDRNWGLRSDGPIYDLIKREEPEISAIHIREVHFMRRPARSG